jgi:hypothetical protein
MQKTFNLKSAVNAKTPRSKGAREREAGGGVRGIWVMGMETIPWVLFL